MYAIELSCTVMAKLQNIHHGIYYASVADPGFPVGGGR